MATRYPEETVSGFTVQQWDAFLHLGLARGIENKRYVGLHYRSGIPFSVSVQ